MLGSQTSSPPALVLPSVIRCASRHLLSHLPQLQQFLKLTSRSYPAFIPVPVLAAKKHPSRPHNHRGSDTVSPCAKPFSCWQSRPSCKPQPWHFQLKPNG